MLAVPKLLVPAVAVLLLIPTVVRLSGADHVLVEQFLSFQFQYAVFALAFAVLIALVGFWRRRPDAAFWLALLAGIVNGFWIAPYMPGFSDGPQSGSAARTPIIMVANVQYPSRDASRFIRELARTAPDILVMIEASPPWMAQLAEPRQDFPFHAEHAADHYFGVAVWSKFPITKEVMTPIEGWEIPLLTLTLDIGGSDLRLAALHPPPPVNDRYYAARNRILDWTARWVAAERTTATLIAGDLNITPHSPRFAPFLERAGLIDARRRYGLQPGWPTGLPWALRIPIDHILGNARTEITRLEVGDDFGSDHRPLIAGFRLSP